MPKADELFSQARASSRGAVSAVGPPTGIRGNATLVVILDAGPLAV